MAESAKWFDLKEMGQRLADAREMAGLKQPDVAVFLGRKDASVVSRWESGTKPVPLEDLRALAWLYGVGVHELVTGERRGVRAASKKDQAMVRARLLTTQTLSAAEAGRARHPMLSGVVHRTREVRDGVYIAVCGVTTWGGDGLADAAGETTCVRCKRSEASAAPLRMS